MSPDPQYSPCDFELSMEIRRMVKDLQRPEVTLSPYDKLFVDKLSQLPSPLNCKQGARTATIWRKHFKPSR